MTDQTMTIRQMCDAFKVTARTLRFYEAKELLFPIREGQKRLFTKRDRARLKLILKGKRFGFSLEEIRQLLNLYDDDSGKFNQLNETYRMAIDRLEQLIRRRDELEELIEDLRNHMDWASEQLNDSQTSLKVACG